MKVELKNLKKVPWVRFHNSYFFVEPSDKASGIKKMMDMLKADYKDVIVFGDSTNDLSMFSDEWYNVAMGNAIDELKEKLIMLPVMLMMTEYIMRVLN